MPSTFLYPVISVEATHFLEALAQNAASVMYNLQMPSQLKGRDFIIRAIRCTTLQDFAPEFNFFSSGAATQPNADPGIDAFLDRFAFTAAQGEQLGAAGVWRYFASNLDIPYFDADTMNATGVGSLHVILQNLSATAKLISPAGNMTATFWLEPQQAF